jgi:hypothetical protein
LGADLGETTANGSLLEIFHGYLTTMQLAIACTLFNIVTIVSCNA